jgi:hypothetical protein
LLIGGLGAAAVLLAHLAEEAREFLVVDLLRPLGEDLVPSASWAALS